MDRKSDFWAQAYFSEADGTEPIDIAANVDDPHALVLSLLPLGVYVPTEDHLSPIGNGGALRSR